MNGFPPIQFTLPSLQQSGKLTGELWKTIFLLGNPFMHFHDCWKEGKWPRHCDMVQVFVRFLTYKAPSKGLPMVMKHEACHFFFSTLPHGCGSKPRAPGEHQNRWQMHVPPQNGIAIGDAMHGHVFPSGDFPISRGLFQHLSANWRSCASAATGWSLGLVLLDARKHVGMGQNKSPPGIGPQILVNVSIHQGNPFLGYPIFDNHSHVRALVEVSS